jgi:hypothetical protein
MPPAPALSGKYGSIPNDVVQYRVGRSRDHSAADIALATVIAISAVGLLVKCRNEAEVRFATASSPWAL